MRVEKSFDLAQVSSHIAVHSYISNGFLPSEVIMTKE